MNYGAWVILIIFTAIAGGVSAQQNTTFGACGSIITSNMAPVSQTCYVFLSASKSEYSPDTPRITPRPADTQSSAFQKIYPLSTYLMTYADFRLAIGKIQAGSQSSTEQSLSTARVINSLLDPRTTTGGGFPAI